MSKKDYYDVLGVSKGVDDAALKKAYRKQAMKYHPDRNTGDKTAEKKFKEINEAYDVLKDAQKRAAYDQMGHAAFEHGRGGGAGGQGFSGGAGGFEDMFGDVFSDIFGGGGGGRRTVQRGNDLRYNMTITLEEAYEGKQTQIKIPTTDTCDTCDGSGAKKGTKPVTCSMCGGQGQVHVSQGFFNMTRTCPTCEGAGTIIKEKCGDCAGQGRVRTNKTINLTIPKGVDDGTRMRLTGEGEAGAFGGPSGDLYVFINIKKHPLFEREQRDLYIEAPLTIFDAMLGGSIEVPTLDGGKAKVKIPEGTQTGQIFRLRGKGMPVLNRSAFGDLMVTVQVEIPTKLTSQQKDILKNMRDGMKEQNMPSVENFVKKIKKFWKNAA